MKVGTTAATGTVHLTGDRDVFNVSLVAGTRYFIDLEGNPTGQGTLSDPGLFGIFNASLIADHLYRIQVLGSPSGNGTLGDPFLRAIYNPAGTLIPDAANDDANGSREASLDFLATSTGSFAIAAGAYTRRITDLSGPDIANNTSNDDWAGGRNARVVFTPAASGTYFISAGAYSFNTGEYRLSLATTDVTDVIGDTIALAGKMVVGTPTTGAIESSRDRDWFAVTLNAGQNYRIREQGAPSGNGTLDDPLIVGIYDSTGAIISGTGNDDADGTRDSRTSFTPATTGTYYVSAAGFYDYVGTYRLLVEQDTSTDVPASSGSKATVAVGGTYLGIVDAPADQDWIGFAATANTTYQIRVSGLGTGGATLADPVLLGVSAPSGQAVQTSGNDNFGGTKNAQTTFTAPTTGTYFIRAGAWENGVGSYQVAVSKVTDSTAPTLLFTSPTDNNAAVPTWSNISLNFNEAVRAGSGSFTLIGGGKTISIAANSSAVTYSGEVVTIHPTADLAPNTSYSVLLETDAVRDLAGNSTKSITDLARFNFTAAPTSTADTWTLMVYIAADNNLEGAGIDDINEMERVNLPANVNLMVMIDRAGGYDTSNGNWTDTRRGQISFDANDASNGRTIISSLTSIGEQNSGAASTLTNFINWAASTAPATHYGLILWDHGGGIAGSAWDDTSNGANLSLLETRQAIDAASVTHYGMIGFDECLMAITEQTMDLSSRADIIVSSQETEPGDGWEYDRFLLPLASNPGLTPMDLASRIVSTYGDRYAGEYGTTLSSVWTAGLGTLDTALDAFCTQALAATTTAADWTAMREAAKRSHHFGDSDAVDLRDFMLEVTGRVLSPTLQTAATAVANAVGNAVTASAGTVADAAGMSIYLPYGATPVDGSYTPTNFGFLNNVPDWDDFLARL